MVYDNEYDGYSLLTLLATQTDNSWACMKS